jgi:uncharacterized protein (TIGR02757 family)
MSGTSASGAGGAGRRDRGGRPVLRRALDGLYRDFDRVDAAADPVHLVRGYRDAADREIVGFLAAGLAFGRVASVLASITRVLAPMGPSPASFVRRFEPARDAARFLDLGHRWTTGLDLAALLWTLRRMLDVAGSIEAFFTAGLNPGDETVAHALDIFGARARALDVRAVYGARSGRPGVWYFYPRPSDGSACKRLNLFLRWMVRRDTIDLGVWTRVSPAQLVVPLDTHVVRVARCLGLTRVRTPGWRMAAEVTASLRALDANDPVRYDFALCHIGMMNACGFGTARGDRGCPLAGLCRPRPAH